MFYRLCDGNKFNMILSCKMVHFEDRHRHIVYIYSASLRNAELYKMYNTLSCIYIVDRVLPTPRRYILAYSFYAACSIL